MTDWDEIGPEGKALWQRSRRLLLRETAAEPDPLAVAALLEGRLRPEEAAALEAQLAASGAGLDLLLSSRAALGEAPVPLAAPKRAVSRAQTLVGFASAAPRRGFLAWLVGGGLRPMAAAGAFAAYLLVCVVAFNAGHGEGTTLAGPAEEDVAALWDLDIGGIL